MTDEEEKTKEQLIEELAVLRQRLARLEMVEAERRRAAEDQREALQESEQGYRALLDASRDAITLVGLDGTILDCNEATLAVSGLSKEETLGRPFTDFLQLDEKELARYLDILSRLAAGEDVPLLTLRITLSEGETRWLQIRSTLLERDGRPYAIQAIARDITRQKQAEEEVQRRIAQLEALAAAVALVSSSLDLDQVLASVLEGMRRLLDVAGCSIWLPDPATGELVCRQTSDPRQGVVGWRLAPGEGLAGWVLRNGESLIVADALNDGRHFAGVDEHLGRPLRSIMSVPLRVKESVIGTLQAVSEEVDRFDAEDLAVTESLAATAAIAIENARLYEQSRRDAETRSVLLQEVNHRVKNNLAAIIGMLYAARRHTEAAAEPAFQTILKDLIGRVQGLATVHGMLSASQWSPLRLSDLVAQVIKSSLQTAPPDKHVSVDVRSSPVRVTATEANSLAVMINELATNTVKYGLQERDAARITVRISVEDDGAGRMVAIEFRDNGPGYPEDVLHLERYGVGFDLIQNTLRKNLNGELSLRNDGGAVTEMRFRTGAASVPTEV